MPCYHPIRGYRTPEGGITLNPKKGFKGISGKHVHLDIPCGQCRGCRLERARSWAVRISHEASNFDVSSYITLTYNDDNLSNNKSVSKKHIQLFLKRLRKYLWSKYKKKIRFYASGEYGDIGQRPHYHLIIFGYWPKDAKFWKMWRGNRLYTSKELELYWPYGFHSIGEVTFDSACYCAKYVIKKWTSSVSDSLTKAYYGGCETEFGLMSRRPGIGLEWWKKYRLETNRDDMVVCRGREMRPPRYYDKKNKELDIVGSLDIKFSRKGKVQKLDIDELDRRLAAAEKMQEATEILYKKNTI